MTEKLLEHSLDLAFSARQSLLDAEHQSALRLFSGFYEGEPRLLADLYGSTLLLTAYCDTASDAQSLFAAAQTFYLEHLPMLTCVVQKQRQANEPGLKCGKVTFGNAPATAIKENGILHALDLMLNQDASFYLDTRGLREWLMANSNGLDVLNTFAYTGSLGVAALAGGARHVIQVDRSAKFLALARRSAILNRLDLGRMKLRAADVFTEIGSLKKTGTLFDLALLDPPFFSVTEKGKVDLVSESVRLINKIRPLVKDGGRLVVINNALFLAGSDYMQSLRTLCQDGYLEIEAVIAVPEDITGFEGTIVTKPPVDPSPFNHSTKIVVLRVRRR